MDEVRTPVAGDGFYAAAKHRPEEHDGCPLFYRGVVYLGHLVEEDSEEVEVIEAVGCRRCKRSYAGDEL